MLRVTAVPDLHLEHAPVLDRMLFAIVGLTGLKLSSWAPAPSGVRRNANIAALLRLRTGHLLRESVLQVHRPARHKPDGDKNYMCSVPLESFATPSTSQHHAHC